jgi:hypothetical protein
MQPSNWGSDAPKRERDWFATLEKVLLGVVAVAVILYLLLAWAADAYPT